MSMPIPSSDYLVRAERLKRAGQGLLESVEDPDIDRNVATSDLETAATTQVSGDDRLRFSPAPGERNAPADSSPDGCLAALLLEVQSANILMSAGIALNEHGGGEDTQFLQTSISQIDSSSASLKSADNRLRFAPPAGPSADLTAATILFRDNAERALTAISDGTADVIDSVIANLKKVGGVKVVEAIDNLGKSVDIVATASRLIRKGIEKLKSVLDAITNLFGNAAIQDIKEQVKSIWEKIEKGEYTKQTVRWIVGKKIAEDRVAEIIKLPDLKLARLDVVSRELAVLDDGFQMHLSIIKGLLAAVTVAAGILAFLHALGPWLALLTAGVYLMLLAAALLIGMSATGQRPLTKWGAGVCTVIEEAH
jgi:hypothetical protein